MKVEHYRNQLSVKLNFCFRKVDLMVVNVVRNLQIKYITEKAEHLLLHAAGHRKVKA